MKEISTEVLLFGGSADRAVPLSETRKIHRLLPNSQLAVFRAYHCLVDTSCKYATGLVDAFFAEGGKSTGVQTFLHQGVCKDKFAE